MRASKRLAACLALAAAVGACSSIQGNSAKRAWGPTTADLAVAADGDRYLAVRTKKRKAPGELYVQLSRNLWQPFRLEATAGRIGDRPLDAGLFCLEVDVRERHPIDFYSVCVRPVETGLQVFAARAGSASPGQRLFAGAERVDLALEARDGVVHYLARASGDPDYVELGTAPFDEPLLPHTPSLFVSAVEPGAEVGVDHARVVENGEPPPEQATPERAAARAVHAAGDLLLEAFYRLDESPPDRTAARDLLTQALTALDEAAANQPPGRLGRVAAKKLGSARKQAEKALARIDEDRDVDAVLKPLRKAFLKCTSVVGKLDPI